MHKSILVCFLCTTVYLLVLFSSFNHMT